MTQMIRERCVMPLISILVREPDIFADWEKLVAGYLRTVSVRRGIIIRTTVVILVMPVAMKSAVFITATEPAAFVG